MLSSRFDREVSDIVAERGECRKTRQFGPENKKEPPLPAAQGCKHASGRLHTSRLIQKHRCFRHYWYLLVSVHSRPYIGHLLDTSTSAATKIGPSWTPVGH